MRVVCACVPGLRVVRQTPFECLISFICSSNNNIARIVLMLDRLRFHYGSFAMTVTLTYPTDSVPAGQVVPALNLVCFIEWNENL